MAKSAVLWPHHGYLYERGLRHQATTASSRMVVPTTPQPEELEKKPVPCAAKKIADDKFATRANV
jgi:hypothetical protein